MSFFLEPPPLDSDIPPPLDDKLRDNDFDLEEEEIIEDNPIHNSQLPELPTDFRVFSSVATDENVSYSHPPPELQELVIPSSPPLDTGDSEYDKGETTNCDVAKEKESLNDVVSQVVLDQITSNDNILEENSSAVVQDNKVFSGEDVTAEGETVDDSTKTFNATRNSNDIPCEGNSKIDESLQSSETILDDVEFNDFTRFSTTNDIPELKLDEEEDDEFNDFETAIPVNRQLEQVPSKKIETMEPQEISFEADFSAFNAFDDYAEEKNSFNDFQGFKAADSKSEQIKSQLQTKTVAEDDDDFGDFNDFTQAPVSFSIEPVAFVKPANVDGILDMMFPSTLSCSDKKYETAASDFTKEEQIIKCDNFVNKFNDFDSTLALGYLYSNSKASQTLVKALGIDTRNILHGPQWASSSSASSSNMPRYAANMSFSPIEPLKSQTSTLQPSTELSKPSTLQPVKIKSDAVPEVEFDWNSSGLINPLDGPQPKSQQPHEPIHVQQSPASSTHTFENESPFYVVDQEVSQVFEAETKANAGHKSELGESLTTMTAYQWSNDAQQHHLASSNILRTIKLPETHIFTPVKGTSPIAREVVSRDVSPAPDDPYYVAKGTICVKEYHDVEYSLEPRKKSDPDTDFDEFQSAQPEVPITKSDPPMLPLNLLEPQKVRPSAKEIKLEPSVQLNSDLALFETPKHNFNLPLPQPPSALTVIGDKKDVEYSKPTLGISPTEQNGDDDDFNDFQTAPAIKSNPKVVQSKDPITLSPARLVTQQSNKKSTWISAMDDDEISRIEAAFPKCKPDKRSAQKSNDEDEWSDFVAAQPTLPFTDMQLPSMISSNTMGKMSNGDGDDWSDFVSVPAPIAKISLAKSSGAISSQLQSKPNFSSWNQPIGKHQYVNLSTSFLTNEPGNQNQQFTSNNYPYVTENFEKGSITITDNFNYAFKHPEMAMSSIGNHNNHQQQQQQKKPNGISTILPELDFAMPKNLMNLPRSGGGNLDFGKKK